MVVAIQRWSFARVWLYLLLLTLWFLLFKFITSNIIEISEKQNYYRYFKSTGGPRYMRTFYLRFRVYSIPKWPFFCNLTSNLQSSLVFLYANSLYSSLFLESLSLAYNEVHLYTNVSYLLSWWIILDIFANYWWFYQIIISNFHQKFCFPSIWIDICQFEEHLVTIKNCLNPFDFWCQMLFKQCYSCKIYRNIKQF